MTQIFVFGDSIAWGGWDLELGAVLKATPPALLRLFSVEVQDCDAAGRKIDGFVLEHNGAGCYPSGQRPYAELVRPTVLERFCLCARIKDLDQLVVPLLFRHNNLSSQVRYRDPERKRPLPFLRENETLLAGLPPRSLKPSRVSA